MKVVIHKNYGAFKLSQKALDELGIKNAYDIGRNDPKLIKVVESMGEKAWHNINHRLEIVEIPNDVDWFIEDYDGWEWVAEKHRTWGKD